MDADQFLTAIVLFFAVIFGAIFGVWICYAVIKWACIGIARAIRDDKEGR